MKVWAFDDMAINENMILGLRAMRIYGDTDVNGDAAARDYGKMTVRCIIEYVAAGEVRSHILRDFVFPRGTDVALEDIINEAEMLINFTTIGEDIQCE